jgi:diphthamide biosynthesis methyltransferase
MDVNIMPNGSLVFIGLGLYDDADISLKGLQELRQCDVVFAEFYTTILGKFDKKHLETTIDKKIEILSREDTEKGEKIISAALENHVRDHTYRLTAPCDTTRYQNKNHT